MALHPRLERPSLEPPPRRTSNAFVAGLVLAVMGAGFALAMPIAMRTWTEAARRSEQVAKVEPAEVAPADEVAEPVLIPALQVTPPRERASRVSGEVGPRAVPTVGESEDPVSFAEEPGDRDEEEPPAPPEEKAKRDEDEVTPPADDDDDDPDQSEPSGRARDEEEDDTEPPPTNDEGGEDRSAASGKTAPSGKTGGSERQSPTNR